MIVGDPVNLGFLGIRFLDTGPDEWNVTGGEIAFGAPHEKKDEIKFRAQTFDPQTGQPVDSLGGITVLVSKFGDGAFADPDPNPPSAVQAEVREAITDKDGNTLSPSDFRTFKRLAPNPGRKEIAEEGLLDQAGNSVSNSELKVRKDIVLSPGTNPGNMVELKFVSQFFNLPSDDKVGCLPEILEQQDGDAQSVENCGFPQGQSPPPSTFFLAQKGGATHVITAGSGGDPLNLHSFQTAAGVTFDQLFFLRSPFPAVDADGSLVSLTDFDTNNTGG